jgi:hypothetical protein
MLWHTFSMSLPMLSGILKTEPTTKSSVMTTNLESILKNYYDSPSVLVAIYSQPPNRPRISIVLDACSQAQNYMPSQLNKKW